MTYSVAIRYDQTLCKHVHVLGCPGNNTRYQKWCCLGAVDSKYGRWFLVRSECNSQGVQPRETERATALEAGTAISVLKKCFFFIEFCFVENLTPAETHRRLQHNWVRHKWVIRKFDGSSSAFRKESRLLEIQEARRRLRLRNTLKKLGIFRWLWSLVLKGVLRTFARS